jgi:hypothetical protein
MSTMGSSTRLGHALLVCVAAAACGSSSDTSNAGVDSGIAASGPDASRSDDSSSSPTDSGTSDAGTSDSGPGGDDASPSTPTIPSPTGTCPTFANGTVTFSPAGIPPRPVQIYMTDAAKTMQGPLIFYWYATGSSTIEAAYSLGSTLDSIEAAGGIVVVPTADPSAGQFQWFIVNGSPKLDDFLVADEVVACAAKNPGVDTTHIHAMGMSAGALQTTAMSFMRSAYVASVATYSGGMPPGFVPMIEDPANKFAALIFDGGSTDNVYGVDFQAASQTYYSTLKSAGHFAAICNHGMGHSIPTDAAPSVAMFFQANGFGVSPSPYVSGLPASFPTYCML